MTADVTLPAVLGFYVWWSLVFQVWQESQDLYLVCLSVFTDCSPSAQRTACREDVNVCCVSFLVRVKYSQWTIVTGKSRTCSWSWEENDVVLVIHEEKLHLLLLIIYWWIRGQMGICQDLVCLDMRTLIFKRLGASLYGAIKLWCHYITGMYLCALMSHHGCSSPIHDTSNGPISLVFIWHKNTFLLVEFPLAFSVSFTFDNLLNGCEDDLKADTVPACRAEGHS